MMRTASKGHGKGCPHVRRNTSKPPKFANCDGFLTFSAVDFKHDISADEGGAVFVRFLIDFAKAIESGMESPAS
jgi:hypothetical protein